MFAVEEFLLAFYKLMRMEVSFVVNEIFIKNMKKFDNDEWSNLK